MTHLNPQGQPCECGFGERLLRHPSTPVPSTNVTGAVADTEDMLKTAWGFRPEPTPSPEELAQGRTCFFHPDRPAVSAQGFAAMCPQCLHHYEQSWRPPGASERAAGTDRKPYEAQMFHGSQRGLLGPVRTPFWTTSHEPEAQGFSGGVVHPVSVRFQRPMHCFGALTPDWREQAEVNGNDGVVVHFPEDMRDPSDPYPKRTWAIALDPGTIVPGHPKPYFE